MKLTHIEIENFKSIKDIEFDVKKYGNSYTTVLVGINESGKSSILEAMSYFKPPAREFSYGQIHNQKDEDGNYVDIWFSLEFENRDTCRNELRKEIDENKELLHFEIIDIKKNVYLEEDETKFSSYYSYEIKKLPKGIFIKKEQKVTVQNGQSILTDHYNLSKNNDSEESLEELTPELLKKYFGVKISKIIEQYEPTVSLWKASDAYLISNVDLNSFKDDVESNIPLKHIFYVAGFKNAASIKSEIEKINNNSLRRKLAGTLGEQVTKYVRSIWKHSIKIDIEINTAGICVVSVCDEGEDNRFNYHDMSARSEGFKQFMSLILSLSIKTRMANRGKDLILIDEPETHLHPSGIRDLRKELLAIGKENYLFVSTHSPFLIDRKNKERNIIIRKNSSAETEKVVIDEHTSTIDDEVLREAFGLEVYNDLLNPHSILVEGASDKKLLLKAFKARGLSEYGITNGHGSNIDTLASKLNDTGISILVALDDDEEGRSYKEKIRKIGGSYTADNVVTIKDLVGGIIAKGTIEDTLNLRFVESMAQKSVDELYPGEGLVVSLATNLPLLEQIKLYLRQNGKNKVDISIFSENLKTRISEDFAPTKTSLVKDAPLLSALVDALKLKLS